jgi:predicted adenine nucleotide alpha hydrolase (AANH) superfamily ATPase
MKLLLHTCCGPCFLGVCEDLGKKDIEVTNYFYNPNIYPEAEYSKRLKNFRIAARGKNSRIIIEKYKPEEYSRIFEGMDSLAATRNDNKERCLGCYRLRLTKTAEYAKKHGFDAFSTTLLVSPYQQHEALKTICEDISTTTGEKFYYTDWRPHFRAGQDNAKFIPIYRQKYCGCEYSLQEQK